MSEEAVEEILTRNLFIDCIVGADDETCLGAMQALKKHNLHVPEDIALVGFDDIEESQFVTPPLTTVAQPLQDMGTKAVEQLITLMAGQKIESISIKPKVIIRQSCGCFELAPKRIDDESQVLNDIAAPSSDLDEIIARALYWMEPECEPFIRPIVESFFNEIAGISKVPFAQVVDRMGRRLLDTGHDLRNLQNVFFELWYYALPKLDKTLFSRADDALQRARVVVGEIVVREQGLKRIQTIKNNYELHTIGDTLANTLEKDQLLDVMSEELTALGVKTFYLSVYESEDGLLSDRSRFVLACEGGERVALPEEGLLFDTWQLVPDGFFNSERLHSLIVEPLFFQDEQYGLILFESELRDGNVYEVLREYISNSMHFAHLIGTIKNQANCLSVANRELEVLRAKDIAYITSVNSELELGKKIQLGFLPEFLPEVDGYELANHFLPARKVSGDFYDVFKLGRDRVAFIIADVSGKDVSAALFMALIRTLLRVFSEKAHSDGQNPLSAMEVVNNYIVQHHQARENDGRCMFATVFFGLLTPSTGVIQYINAGHNSPFILRSGSSVLEKIKATGPAVGFMENITFREARCCLLPEDIFFTYTDGVPEAVGKDNSFYSNDRLIKILESGAVSAAALVQTIVDDLLTHIQDADASDDITMLTIKRID